MKNIKDGDLLYDRQENVLGMILDVKNYILTANSSKRYKMIWLNELEPIWEWEEYIIIYRLDYLEHLRNNSSD